MTQLGIRRALLVVGTLLALAVGSCGGDEDEPMRDANPPAPSQEARDARKVRKPILEPGSPVDLATARRIHQRYGDKIGDSYQGVIGHGIGAADEGSSPGPTEDAYVIVVFLDSPSDEPRTPQSIAGVPLRFQVTGSIGIQPAQPAG